MNGKIKEEIAMKKRGGKVHAAGSAIENKVVAFM